MPIALLPRQERPTASIAAVGYNDGGTEFAQRAAARFIEVADQRPEMLVDGLTRRWALSPPNQIIAEAVLGSRRVSRAMTVGFLATFFEAHADELLTYDRETADAIEIGLVGIEPELHRTRRIQVFLGEIMSWNDLLESTT